MWEGGSQSRGVKLRELRIVRIQRLVSDRFNKYQAEPDCQLASSITSFQTLQYIYNITIFQSIHIHTL